MALLTDKPDFVIKNQIDLKPMGYKIPTRKASSKRICAEVRSRISTPLTAQQRYTTLFSEDFLEWK